MVCFYKKKSSNLVTISNYVIDAVYIYSWKKIDKILTHFGDALCKNLFIYLYFLFAHGVQHDNGEHPLGVRKRLIEEAIDMWEVSKTS